MSENYLTHNYLKSKKFLHFNLTNLIKDLLTLFFCIFLIVSYGVVFLFTSQYILTYVVGLIIILSCLPIITKIVIKIILNFTLGFFMDVYNFIESFDLGFVLISAGILLYSIFILVNATSLFVFSLSSLSLGASLLIL